MSLLQLDSLQKAILALQKSLDVAHSEMSFQNEDLK